MSAVSSDYYYTSDDGLRLYSRIYSAHRPGGLPVLCLPGLTRNSRDFVALAAHLRAEHEVISADLRGRGHSAWDPDPSHYQLSTYVRDAWSLLDSRAVTRVLLVGTSLGALISMVMAATRPDRIAGIILNDAGPEIDPVGLRRIAGYTGKLPPVSSWAEAATQAKSVYGLALPGLSDEEWLEYARCGYRENATGIPVPDMDPKISEAFNNPSSAPGNLWTLYSLIRGVPLLVIRGASSDILSVATLARMTREKPDIERVTVPNRGHTPLLNEAECLTAIDAFVARYGRFAAHGDEGHAPQR
jgi:pimeloyl-ACP methyl ester carboxylesterase